MDIKDYIENDIALEIPKNNGTSKLIYPFKAKKCFATRKGYNGRIIKQYCVLYNEKERQCDGSFKCENEKPLEKCYKAIAPFTGEYTVEITEHFNYNLVYRIMKLRNARSKS